MGGDDLQPAAVLAMAGRFLQLVVLCVPVLRHAVFSNRGDHGCGGLFDSWTTSDDPASSAAGGQQCRFAQSHCWLLAIWICSTVLYNMATFVLEARIAYWSSQGSPTEIEPRSQRVSRLLELKLYPCTVLLLLIWTTGIVAVLLAPAHYRCQDTFLSASTAIASESYTSLPLFLRIKWWWVAVAVLLISQAVEIVLSSTFLWQLYRLPIDALNGVLGDMQVPSSREDMDGVVHYNHELMEEMWAERCAASCQCLSTSTCYMFGGRNAESSGPAAFGDVARALADFLESRGVLDVVPSDIVTGLVVLQRLQRQRVYAARQQYLNDAAITIGQPTKSCILPVEQNSVIDAPKLNLKSATSGTIRKRTSGKNLTDPEEGLVEPTDASRPGDEDSLFPFEGATKPISKLHPQAGHRSLYRIDHNGSYQRNERALLNRMDYTELYILDEGARYAKYALAIYSWILYLYEHPISGPCRLLAESGCVCCCHSRRRARGGGEEMLPSASTTRINAVSESYRVEGDNLCQTHKNAILLTAGLEEADLVYVQFESSFSDVPYCILLDHAWKSVVVSIRGTFSLEDCITDVLIEPESLEKLGEEFGFDATGQHCHGGVLSCARNVYRDLERHCLLDEHLVGDNARCPGYTLRLVGHSLGAATCTLVSYMLRRKFPDLRCVNYSPPGCTFSWEMATQCKEWCTSFVLDTDLVPRLKVESIERLRDEILDLIGRIKVPKIEVARRFVHASFQFCSEKELEEQESLMESMNDILYDPSQVPDSEYQQQLERFKSIQDERRQRRGTTRAIHMYPPGRILQLAKAGEKRSCASNLAKVVTCCMTNVGFRYVPVWVNNDDLNEIVVSATMGTDHFPNRMRAILEEVADDLGRM